MPHFGHEDGFDTVSYITGPTHVLLGLRFGEPANALELIKRPPSGGCDHGPLDEQQIAEAIQSGVGRANAENGSHLAVAQAFYVENDSPNYALFARCAYLLASRKAQGATPPRAAP